MSDGLTITILGLLIVLSGIGVGVYFWINRPQAATHDDEEPRIQPLFGSEQSHALDHVGAEPFVEPTPVEMTRRTPAGSAAAASHPYAAASSAPLSHGREMASAAVPIVSTSSASNGLGGAAGAAASAASNGAAHAGGSDSTLLRRAPVVTPRGAPVVSPVAAAAATATAATGGTARDAAPLAARGDANATAIRFSIPTDGTLQFLPGRLEVMGGSERGREIRFVRQPSFEAPTVTFGRSEGEPYRHVQLVDPTVSRQHARLRLSEAGWLLTNLSTTNPVAHNGAIMAEHAEVLLAEGDRIDMGEVVFRFRAR